MLFVFCCTCRRLAPLVPPIAVGVHHVLSPPPVLRMRPFVSIILRGRAAAGLAFVRASCFCLCAFPALPVASTSVSTLVRFPFLSYRPPCFVRDSKTCHCFIPTRLMRLALLTLSALLQLERWHGHLGTKFFKERCQSHRQ